MDNVKFLKVVRDTHGRLVSVRDVTPKAIPDRPSIPVVESLGMPDLVALLDLWIKADKVSKKIN